MTPSLDVLASRYVAAAQAHARATLQSPVAADTAHDALVRTFHDIRDSGESGWARIRDLTLHPDNDVRLWAATHLLQADPVAASEALKTLERLDGLVGFEASIVLQERRAGRLTWA